MPHVAICQKNDQPEDEKDFDMEIVILEGKELRIAKWQQDKPEPFNVPAMTATVESLGFDVTTDWEYLDGRAFAVVERRGA